MDLRSAHKTPEKPPPRLRLSLTRSLVSEDEDQPYSACRQDPQPHQNSKSRRSQFKCLDSNPPSPTEEDWEGREEEEQEEDSVDYDEGREEEEEEREASQKEATEKSQQILNGKCVSRSASRL